MAERSVGDYLERVVVRIRTDFPVELGALPSEELRAQVQVAFDRFRAQNFQRKEYLYRLIVLEILFGPRFEVRLPEDVRLFAFPPPDKLYPPEPERFWAIYQVAEHLTRADAAPTSMPANGVT